MTVYYEDTIAAISTPVGFSGIGIVRISGKDAFVIIEKLFHSKYNKEDINVDRKLYYGHIIHPQNNTVIDEVLVSRMSKPNTYTKENVVEINCHGGMISVKKILNLLIENGARLAEPGEFTKRAFLNGRIDLTQAEAVMDIINAKTDQSLELSMRQLRGGISQQISKLRNHIVEMLAHIEASIDYPEYDIEEISYTKILNISQKVYKDINTLIYHAENGKIIREGILTAIIGKPNVGKSSLLNALMGEQRAIVTEIPGTTRDTIEEYINIEGVPLKIIDTAGIRETKNEIERIGINKAKDIIQQSDLILMMFDVSDPLNEDDLQLIKLIEGKKAILLLNKVDKEKKISKQEFIQYEKPLIEISATEQIGLRELKEEIINVVFEHGFEKDAYEFISNIRHIQLLNKAKNSINSGMQTIKQQMPLEIVSIDLKDAWMTLGEITGETMKEDLIDQIFSNFCIGK
ncbi:MAG: tRNA uridine-5-carboxymethylaminomethyl(34) synthesis GTPase MnmE [Eubacteriales bacterium]